VSPDEVPWDEFTADGEPVGWRVIDRDGNVVAQGPGMTLEMVSDMGDGQQEATDGGD
jgi:hypothetical protein